MDEASSAQKPASESIVAERPANVERETDDSENSVSEKEEEQEHKAVLDELKASVAAHARSGTFACGGSVAIEKPIHTTTSFIHGVGPLQIRFGAQNNGKILNLPADASQPSQAFSDFLSACAPASFARAGEEVLDESYRKAGKLDVGEFLTSFCPYQAGIFATIEQLLVPQTKQTTHVRSIKAELYKLNVYSAPSGKFKAHVDTPRSQAQLGSLVVSLPVDHQGGQLVVRHVGEEVVFDWATSTSKHNTNPAVDWAAFYSDCEHEVLEVSEGHRVTLAYNLYVTRGAGHLAGVTPILDATKLPLYKTLQLALSNPNFLKRGRVLAIWLSHSYAHTSMHVNFLPESLKGADMSLYETALALDLHCQVVPVIPKGGYGAGDDSDSRYGDDDYYDTADLYSKRFHGFNHGQNDSGNLGGEEDTGWGRVMPRHKYTWVNPSNRKLREVQLAHIVYGNDLGNLNVQYSRAAMLIRIPPYSERGIPSDESESIWAGIKRDNIEYSDFSAKNDGYEEGMGGLI